MGREWLARQAVLSRPNGPKDFQMVMLFVSTQMMTSESSSSRVMIKLGN